MNCFIEIRPGSFFSSRNNHLPEKRFAAKYFLKKVSFEKFLFSPLSEMTEIPEVPHIFLENDFLNIFLIKILCTTWSGSSPS